MYNVKYIIKYIIIVLIFFSRYVMTFTITIIAIDRYQAIHTRFYRRISNVLPIRITIKLIWIAAVLFATPELVFNKLVEYKVRISVFSYI